MKKYIKPAIVEVAIDNESILAASPNFHNEQGDRVHLANEMEIDFDFDEED